MGKILAILAIVISIITAVLGFINYGSLSDARQGMAEVDSRVQQINAELEKTRGELKSTEDSLATATAEKESALAQAETAKADSQKAKDDLVKVEGEMKQQQGEISKLSAEVDAKQAQIDQLKASVPATDEKEPSEDLTAKIAEQETVINKLQADLASARAQAQELQRERADRLAQRMREGLQGKILAVNRAWNFVVLNIGDKNGVVSNAEMLVKRGNSLIGRVKISSVEPSTSIADIDPGSVPQGLVISPGDRVIFQGGAEALN